jgi:hypothetical protein
MATKPIKKLIEKHEERITLVDPIKGETLVASSASVDEISRLYK